jgi:hypothetical protein
MVLPPTKKSKTTNDEEETKTSKVTPDKAKDKFIKNNDHDSGNYLPRPSLVLEDIKEEDK